MMHLSFLFIINQYEISQKNSIFKDKKDKL